MTEDNQNASFDDAPKKIEGDRDIPLVAQNTNFSKLGIMLFIFVGVCAIIAVAMDGMDKSKPKPMTEAAEEEFRAPSSGSEPYIQVVEQAPSQEQLTSPNSEYDPMAAQREFQMQQEALRLAREQQKRKQERLHSDQLIYDQSSSNIQSPNGSTPSGSIGSGNLLGGGDENLSFANQYNNADVEVATASQLQNLHALIPQGTMIGGILETAIQSDLPGMVRAIVSDDVYSFDNSHLLVPKGSRLIGRYKSGLVRGQSRVFVIWTRLIRNDGVSINIGSYGTDDLGRSGLDGTLDTHFFERFSSSVLLSLIDAGLQIGVNSLDDDDSATIAVETGNDFSRAAEIALENSIAIPPTIHVDQGERIKVFVGKDLDFSNVAGNVARSAH